MLFVVKQNVLNWHFTEERSEKWVSCYYTELPSHLSGLQINAYAQNDPRIGSYRMRRT